MSLRGIVLGWYHKRNAGDDRLAYCIERWLGDHELTFMPHTKTPPLDVLSDADYVILGGGSIANEVHGAFHNMKKWIDAARIPVFGVGLTVSHHPQFRHEFQAISDSGGLIWVRDQQSADFLQMPGAVHVIPDLAWLYPRPTGGRTRTGEFALNLRSAIKRGFDPVIWKQALENHSNRWVPWPLSFGHDDDRSIISSIIGTPVPEEYDPFVPQEVSLVCAMRFHAIIFAIQAGTPFVAIDNSKKLSFMLESIGLSKHSISAEDPNRLSSAVESSISELSSSHLLAIAEERRSIATQEAAKFKARIEEQVAINEVRRKSTSSRLRRRIRGLIGN